MLRFKEFLWDIRYAWCVVVPVFIVFLVLAGWKYQTERTAMILHIAILQELESDFFTEVILPYKFKVALRTLYFEKNIEQAIRPDLLKTYSQKEYQEFRDAFEKFDDVTLSALLERKNVQGLVDAALQRYNAIQFNLFYGLWPAITSWQVVGVLSLLFFWWREGYIMNYFPYRKWWFWLYLAFAWPWSLAIGFCFSISFLLRGIQFMMARYRSRFQDTPYEVFCQKLMADLSQSRAEFSKSFPFVYRKRRLEELDKEIPSIRSELEDLGTALYAKERKYRTLKATLIKLQNGDHKEESSGADITEEYQRWQQELDKILAQPYVKALRVGPVADLAFMGRSCLEVFTAVIPTFFGSVGPVRVVISIEPDAHFIAVGADVSSVRGHNAFGGGSFCFGRNHSILSGLVHEKKFNEAVGLMITSFQAVSYG